MSRKEFIATVSGIVEIEDYYANKLISKLEILDVFHEKKVITKKSLLGHTKEIQKLELKKGAKISFEADMVQEEEFEMIGDVGDGEKLIVITRFLRPNNLKLLQN